MYINNNISSLININNLYSASSNSDRSIKKLSSGIRINSASDDAAGLSISAKLRAQSSSLTVAQRNIHDGISLLQTAEGAMDEIHNMLSRAYELSIQSSNGIYSDDEKESLVNEVRLIKVAIDDIVNSTSFNGVPLFQGDSVSLQVGINAGDTLEVETPNLTHLVRHIVVKDMPIDKIATPENIANMINKVSTARASLGAMQNRLEHSLSNTVNTHENLISAESRIRDTDMAKELAVKSKYDLMCTTVSTLLSKTMKSSDILELLG